MTQAASSYARIEGSPFASLDRGAYGAIVADPPWYFRTRTTVVSDRDPQRHYPVMGVDQIMALPVREIAAADAHLFLWATGPCLPQAFAVIEAWGFRYSGVAFTWVKLKKSYDALQLRMLPTAESDLHVGLGFTTRKNAEFCLLARRGSAKRVAKNVREIILSPVREHSRKPEEFRDRVEAYVGPGIRIAELFARSSRPGWDAWGNETTKFDALEEAT
jgi:N6-adenosine-specific RNA methylase IME4